jgi:hypothetical protein
LSPTPPVECLSSTGPSRPDQSSTAPESRIASVSATASSRVMPLKKTAMAKAATWPSVTSPLVRPATMNAISSRVSGMESRFLRMISWGSILLSLSRLRRSSLLLFLVIPAKAGMQ